MFIPPPNYKKTNEIPANAIKGVHLKSAHLLIGNELASQAFGDCQNVYVVYYPDHKKLMLAPVTDEVFKQLHKSSQHMLKDKNLQGDKSIALHELLIDNQLDDADRKLDFTFQKELRVLTIFV